MNKKQISMAILMMLGVAIFHFFIPREFLSMHILFRLLYLFPVAYIALYSGRKGGILAALAMTIIFLPHFFMDGMTKDFAAGNTAGVILFFITGFFVGSFRDFSERGAMHQQQQQVVVPTGGKQCHILFYIDNSPLSIASAGWFAACFGGKDITITLLRIFSAEENEKSADGQLSEKPIPSQEKENTILLERIQDILTDSGIPVESIVKKAVVVTGKVRASDKILDELNNGQYDLLLLSKHQQTKAQEFMFGDAAIRLLREASIPVLAVKGSSEKSSNPL